MTALLGLLFSKVGGLAVAAIGVAFALLRAFYAGRASERAKQTEASLNAVKERKSVDEDIGSLSDNAVRQRLRDRWGR